MSPLFVSNRKYREAVGRIDGLNGTFSTAAFSVYKIQTTQASGIQLHNDMLSAEHQVSSLVAASEEISASISEVNSGVVNLADETHRLKSALNSGDEAVTTSENEIAAIESRVTELQSTVLDLKDRVDQVVHVAEVIQGIASQTNLLALNAAIEAARAGEAGKGFAVVAEEVRKLADETHKQSEGITKSIREVASSIDTTVELTRASVHSVEAGREANRCIRDSYDAIIGVADSVTKMTNETQCQLEEQRTATELIVQCSEELARLVSSIAQVADYLNSTTGICVDKTKQVWQSLLNIRTDDHTFILDRIIDHAMWLRKLADAVTSGNSDAELADHRSCKLGKWYQSPEGKAIRNQSPGIAEIYDSLDKPHEELHTLGLQAIQAASRGNEHEAHEKMLAAFKASARVVDLLVNLAGKIKPAAASR